MAKYVDERPLAAVVAGLLLAIVVVAAIVAGVLLADFVAAARIA